MATDPMDQVRELIGRARRRLGQVIEPAPHGATDRRSALVRDADATVAAAFAAIDAATAAAETGAVEAIELLGLDTEVFTLQERTSRSAAVATASAGQADEFLAEAQQLFEALRDRLQAAVVPVRPGTADAASEAALANLRGDLRMVLDGVVPEALPAAFVAELAERQANGAALDVWFIAATSWPADYMRSRGGSEGGRMLAALLDEVLSPADSDDTRVARRIIETLVGRYGMPTAILAARELIAAAFNDLTVRGIKAADAA